MNESNDDPRDAHLLAALRHAPDRDATPPREVSERILAAARAAARSSRAAVLSVHETPEPWWQRLSAWLTQPQVAASFGTLVVALLVGVMWSTREPPVAEFTPPPKLSERVESPRQSAPADPLLADAAKAEGSVTATPAAAEPAAVSEARPQAAPVARPKQASPKESAVRREADREPGLEPRQRAAAAAPPAETAVVASPAAPPPAVAAPAPQVADAALAPPAAAAERRAAGGSGSRGLDLRRDAAPARPASAALGMALTAKANNAAVADPLARWDADLGADTSTRVLWRLGERRDAPPTAHGAAQTQWWAALRRATAGTWSAQSRGPSTRPVWLSFEVSAKPAVSIYWVGDAVHVCPADAAACWSAPTTPTQREAWIAEIARW